MSKAIDLEHDLVPIGRFRSQTSKILETLREEGRTVVITQNGRAAAVVLSPREFDALRHRQALVEDVARGLADVEAGRTKTTAQLRASLKKRRKK